MSLRSRAILGCGAVVVMIAFGLPSMTATAAEGDPLPVDSVAPAGDVVVETTVPETTAPATTVPETTAPDTTMPEPVTETVPEPTTAETTVPDTTVAETVPEPAAPDNTVADTTAAETTVPLAVEPTDGAGTDTVPTTDPATIVDAMPTTSEPAPDEAALVAAALAPPVASGVGASQSDVDGGGIKYRVVAISWSGTAGAEYEVSRRFSTSSTWSYVGTTYDPSTSISDTLYGSDTFGWYQYRVTPSIYDPEIFEYVFGTPGYVSVLVTAPLYPPSLPRAVRATRTNSTVQVTWSAPTIAAYTCESTGYYFCSPATSYIVSWAPAGGAWQSVTTTGTSRTLSGLRAPSTYYVSVRAVNAAGRSGATPSVRAGALGRPGLVPMRGAPEIRQVTLRWTAPATNGSPVTRYLIQRRPADSSTWTYVSTNTPATATSFTVRGLAAGGQYYFRILAVNGIGWGAWSTPILVRPATHQVVINLILVGRELFTAVQIAEVNAALAAAREIYAKVGIYLRVAGTYGLTAAQAGGYVTIDNAGEAVDLTSRWSFPGHAVDLFVVRRWLGPQVGQSALDGSCNKNDNSYGGMTGTVAEIVGSAAVSGVVMAHEVGHYLGLDHSYVNGNFMYPSLSAAATAIQTAQGDVMKRHCFVSPG